MRKADMDSETVALSADDLTLLTDVLDTNPSMHSTVYAVKLVEQRLSYPLTNLVSLTRAFSERTRVQIRHCDISPEQVERYLPESCFPIHNRHELISQLIMAFERERMSVVAELAAAQGHEVAWEAND